MKKQDKNISFRQVEIVNQFLAELDQHLADLQSGQVETAYEVNQFAELLFINPNHLSDTVKEVIGKSPCAVYEEKLIVISKDMIINTNKPINEIARILDYDPSNFTKFFKRFTGKTPKKYRNDNRPDLKTEKVTI
ncbi:helix-turn-helix domain-containing protein [Chryseobacterium sp. SIMBA_028]|uniref:helix-turn-helix domain-containing protein n=1 Tax=Chryseobacterium sp. SIMBA_028 TaxID=3085771 RepID=UPI00397E1F30